MAAVAATFWLLAAPPLSDASVAINGDVLRVYANPEERIQARFVGFDAGEFDSPFSDSGAAFAGLALNVYADPNNDTPAALSGPFFGGTTPISGPTLSGSGTEADPYELTSVNVASSFGSLDITQVLSYVNGDSGFLAHYRIRNSSASEVFFRPAVVGDLFSAASDYGSGFYDATAPVSVGGVNDVAGGFGELVQVDSSPWSRFQAGSGADVFGSRGMPEPAFRGVGFSNTVDPQVTDDAVGVQWDTYRSTGLAAGATDDFDVVWNFGHFNALTLFPGDESRVIGTTEHQTARALNGGAALGGKTIRYTIAGANPGSGAVTTDSGGNADVSWTGINPGRDALTAFMDTNADGAQQDDEPGDVTTLIWTSPPASSPTPPPPAVAATLKASAAKLQHVRRTHRIAVVGRCNKACTITGVGNVNVPGAARVFSLRAVHHTLRAPGRAKLTFSLSKKVRKAISAALRRHRRVTAKITLIAKTGSLTSRPSRVTVRLVR